MPMELYTFYLLDRDGAVRAFEFDHCEDDLAAGEHALIVLARHPERCAVEVRRGDELVYPRQASPAGVSSRAASWRRDRHR